ncbi:hypothetical protein BX265_3079 [Streptomyces sp. TLI_235]|nr:hypothetical protein [Streptomyces sp. TLI_235]PBC78316.1 hypothetical protein BX265_3079 [Streptomyces sp. TLI_235]
MSRGRHRHSSVLGRYVPPAAIGVLVLAAVAALVATPDPVVARSVGVAAVVAAVGLGLLLRQRDRAARGALQLAATRRLRLEERFEEQLAEAEYAAEVAEERATRFGRRLTAEKSRLAKAETEIARLLRERAVMVAEQAMREAEAAKRAREAARPKHPASPAAYVRAAAALRHLERLGTEAEERRQEGEARAQLALRPRMPQPVPVARPQAPAAEPVTVVGTAVDRPSTAPQPLTAPPAVRPRTGTVVPSARVRAVGRGAGFSFFGRPATAAALRAAAPAPAVGDLADVVGDEALAESVRYSAPADRPQQAEQAPAAPAEEAEHGRPEVVDLTPHEDTEMLQLPELRAGRS